MWSVGVVSGAEWSPSSGVVCVEGSLCSVVQVVCVEGSLG